MKSIWFFIKTTVKGGVFFFFPVVFIYVVIQKASGILAKIITPLAEKFGIDGLAGKATLGILVAIVILLICFIGGLLMRIKQMKRINEKLEEFLMEFTPKYKRIKPKSTKEAV
jgi:uncharacterized membrane protein